MYYVSDLLWSDGADVTHKPILERRAFLKTILKPIPGIQIGAYVEEHGRALFELTKQKGIEGIVAKRKTVFIGLVGDRQTG